MIKNSRYTLKVYSREKRNIPGRTRYKKAKEKVAGQCREGSQKPWLKTSGRRQREEGRVLKEAWWDLHRL